MFILLTGLTLVLNVSAQQNARQDISLDKEWRTISDDRNVGAYNGFEQSSFADANWKKVDVPHNWDAYEGYRRLKHGNRHGYAWYRKTFSVDTKTSGKRYFLWFEGVGSYATVWLNGKQVGHHAGGRTTFTLDVTDAIYLGNKVNLLSVRADHPASIQDLPWVCGGCSDEVGFSEGSQPMGIFRPVHLIITDPVRIEPFGVHIWNDTTVSERSAILFIETEIKNYSDQPRTVTVSSRLVDKAGKSKAEIKEEKTILPGSSVRVRQQTPTILNPHLWSLEDPYSYTLISNIIEKGQTLDEVSTPYGIRWIRWPASSADRPASSADRPSPGTNQFFLNGKPVFINGIAEYEHFMGQSHAFTEEQIRARVMQMKSAGFNAFRDAHQPHNLRYQKYWDDLGLLWWTQMAAHVWFDTPVFRNNFKALLTEWVKERRNSPSLVLWGLENESRLPRDFAMECTALIRSLDPTTSSQRKVTTCNGGEGTDWDVPQNWTGTYGGNPLTYADDIQKQVLIGEYGAWRSLDLHTTGPFKQNGAWSEDRMTQLMETKIRLAESVKDKCSGHFHWLFTSHENPGRIQGGEGLREIDRVGPVNYKGLLSPWGEPLDVFYMFRANYAPKEKEPMVYIVSHTWPDRWIAPGKKDSIIVYSNCDEVELFNDVGTVSLGKKHNQGIGTHFQWDAVPVKYNVLYAVGYVKGKAVARDQIVLHHLPVSPNFNRLMEGDQKVAAPQKKLNYLYRVNCGGPDYVDQHGSRWMADVHKIDHKSWGSTSWTDDFPGMPPFYASQRKTNDPVKGTADGALFQTFRYGGDKLRYDFPVANGNYSVELYFIEPWYGTGGGMDCTGWRLFDVAVNGHTVLKDLDIWKEAGHDTALKKTVNVKVTDGRLSISFPRVASGQAIISAIAIATRDANAIPASTPSLVDGLIVSDKASVQTWLTTGDKQYTDEQSIFNELPPELYGATWIRTNNANGPSQSIRFRVTDTADVYVALDARITGRPAWMNDYEDTKTFCASAYQGTRFNFRIWRKRFPEGSVVSVEENGKISTGNAQMYSVMVLPVTTLQPATDLRPSVNYPVSQATFGKAITPDTVLDKRCVTFLENAGSTLEWKISLGVANLYALRFRYFHTSTESRRINFKVVAADGSILHEEVLNFIPVTEKKWKVVSTSTGTMINAGNYRVVLTSLDAKGLSIRDLEIQ
jgi:beta-galactosidase